MHNLLQTGCLRDLLCTHLHRLNWGRLVPTAAVEPAWQRSSHGAELLSTRLNAATMAG